MTPKYPGVKVQLSGEDVNVIVIIGRVQRALRKAGAPPAELIAFGQEARSGDYDHVLQTCMAWVDVS